MQTTATGETASSATTDHPGPDPQHPARVTVQKLRLLHDYILVRPLAAPLKKAGGLMFMPETAGARERNSRGLVVAVGPGDYNAAGTAILPVSVSHGDLVYFGKYAGTEEEFDGQTVLAMRETECRLRVFAGDFRIIEHDDPKLNHLVEDWCDVCYGDPEAEAKARLEAERARFVAAQIPGPVEAAGVIEELPRSAREEVLRDLDAGLPRRACVEDGCLMVQRLVDNKRWVGLSCGHEHPAELEP